MRGREELNESVLEQDEEWCDKIGDDMARSIKR